MMWGSAAGQRGLTLTELMVAVTIGLLLSVGMLQLFSDSRAGYETLQEQMRLQADARFALDSIRRDLRAADFWGCVPSRDMVNDDLGGGDLLGIQGVARRRDTDPDSLTIAGAVGTGVWVADADDLATAGAAIGLEPGDLAVISDCGGGAFFTVPETWNGFEPPELDDLYPGHLYRVRQATYDLGDDANRALRRRLDGGTPQPLINGVEMMRVLYGVDADGDGTANRYQAFDAGMAMEQVVSIKLALLLRSQTVPIAPSASEYRMFSDEDDAEEAIEPDASDLRRLRRVFTLTVALRNRGS